MSATARDPGRDRKGDNDLAEAMRRRAAQVGIDPELLRARLAPVPDFPLGALPEPLRSFVAAGARSLGAPVDYLAVGVLVAAATFLGADCRVQLAPEWQEAARLYAAIIGEPGDAKTPALRLGLRPVHRFQADLYADLARRTKDEGKRHQQRDDVDDDRDDGPHEAYHVAVSDTTLEALCEILHLNPGGVAVAWDELAGWIKSQNAYRNGFGSDREFWQAAWSGSPYQVDRKARDDNGNRLSFMIDAPFACVVGGMQPDVLHALVTTSRGKSTGCDGTLDRILFAWPDTAPQRPQGAIPEDVQQTVSALFSRLRDLRFSRRDGFWAPILASARVLDLDPGARSIWDAAEDGYWALRTDPGAPAWSKGAAAKLRSYRARLALVLAMARTTGTAQSVGREDMQGALALCDYFAAHWRRVWLALYGNGHEKALAAILSWCRRHGVGEITVRQAVTAELAGTRTAADARRLFEALETLGYGRLETRARVGAKPAEVFVLTRTPGDPSDPDGGPQPPRPGSPDAGPHDGADPVGDVDPGVPDPGLQGLQGGLQGECAPSEPLSDGTFTGLPGLQGAPYRGSGPEPPSACHVCQGNSFWHREPNGPWVCAACHPPAPGLRIKEAHSA